MSDSKDVSIAGVSYLHTFAQNIYLLTQQTASYRNFLLKLEKESKDGELTIEQQKLFDSGIEALRHTLYLVHVQYKAISKSVKQIKFNEEIQTCYDKIEKKYVIDRIELDNYVVLINEELMAEALKDLLNTSESMHNRLYNESKEEN